jgi:hypothetical protein
MKTKEPKMLVDISNVKTVTIAEVQEYTYGFDYTKEITKSGVYKIVSGSRGYIEEVEYLGDLDTKEIKLLTKQDCVEQLLCDEDDREELTSYVDEFYGYEVEKDYVQFGFTEEEFDWYFKVTV